jgi:hypothetical protein
MGKLKLYPVGKTFQIPSKSEFNRIKSKLITIFIYKSPTNSLPPKLKNGRIFINKNNLDRF